MTNSYDYEDEETKQYQICFFSNWLLGDHLGSTSMTTDASGVVVSELRYSTFGETRYQNGTLTTDYLYTGQRQEAEIGLYYFVARWYDPAIGRFIQADSVVPNPLSANGLDRYAYGFNNPLLYLDPSGHAPLLLDGMQTVYQDFSYSSHVSKENVENTNNWQKPPEKDVDFPDKNYNRDKADDLIDPDNGQQKEVVGPLCPGLEKENYYSLFTWFDSDIGPTFAGIKLAYEIIGLKMERDPKCIPGGSCYNVDLIDYHKLWIGGYNSGVAFLSVGAKTESGQTANIPVNALDVGDAANEGISKYSVTFLVPNDSGPIVEMWVAIELIVHGGTLSPLFPNDYYYDIPVIVGE